MNEVRIKINRLGAVRDAEFRLRPFMLFMGESGLGKSYVAFLAHYVYMVLSYRKLELFFAGINFQDLLSQTASGEEILSIKTKDLFDWINKDAVSYLRYMIGNDALDADVEIHWPFYEEEISFVYREFLDGLDSEEEVGYSISSNGLMYNRIANQSEIDARIFRILLQGVLNMAVFGIKERRAPYMLPPSRGALMEIDERPVFQSGMYDMFFDFKKELKRAIRQPKEDDPILNALLARVNNGNVVDVDGNVMYVMPNGVTMPLTAAASSVKELAPFAMALKKFRFNRSVYLLEEPESHLHPLRQQGVADVIAYAVNEGVHMQVTTHSDYFVKRLNFLLRLQELAGKQSGEKMIGLLEKVDVIPQSLLNPEKIGAYLFAMRADGTTEIRLFDIQSENMIPYDSFESVIMDDFNNSDIVDEFEAEFGCGDEFKSESESIQE